VTERDSLLERLEQVNPVPDLSRLHEDLETAPRLARDGRVDTFPLRKDKPRTGRGLRIAAAVAALVIIGGAAIGLITSDATDPAAGDGRVLQLTIDGDSCVYEGPDMLAAGEAEIVYRNTSPEARWANTLRLDDDRTVADTLNYIDNDPLAGAPSWSSPVWLNLYLPAGAAPTSRLATLEPGTHILLCGDATRGAIFGANVVVTP
jgi:hypothetical protein